MLPRVLLKGVHTKSGLFLAPLSIVLTVMGGAIFTLADFAAAVAANGHAEDTTITLHGDITYLSPAKGKTLIAHATTVKQGRSAALHQIEIRDDLGILVAHATMNGFVLHAAGAEKK